MTADIQSASFSKNVMRFSKPILIGILLIIAGFVIIYYDQSRGKTRICEYRIRQATTITCTRNHDGKSQIWTLNLEKDPEIFIDLQKVMLADLQTARQDVTSGGVPEYSLSMKGRDKNSPFEFQIYTGRTARIQCNGGTYVNLGHTEKFLRDNATALDILSSANR